MKSSEVGNKLIEFGGNLLPFINTNISESVVVMRSVKYTENKTLHIIRNGIGIWNSLRFKPSNQRSWLFMLLGSVSTFHYKFCKKTNNVF